MGTPDCLIIFERQRVPGAAHGNGVKTCCNKGGYNRLLLKQQGQGPGQKTSASLYAAAGIFRHHFSSSSEDET